MLRDATAALIRWSGIGWLVRSVFTRRRVGIVLYHDPDPESLSRQLGYLRKRYELIPLDRLVDAIESGEWSSMPSRGLVITVDDGLRGNRELLEVFRAHGVRPTIFISSQIVATNRHFWFLEVDPGEAERLKLLDSRARLAELASRWGFEPTRDYGERARQALSRAEIEDMRAVCDFQAHTRFHPILPTCPAEEAREEIFGCREEVERLSRAPCRHLAYPNGAYTEREVELARQAGYRSARTVDIGWNGPGTDPHRLRILSVADGCSDTVLAGDLAGLKWLSRLRRREGGLDGRFRLRGRA